MQILKFVRNAPPYMAGEIAGFPDDQAEKLKKQGAAVSHVTDTEGATSGGGIGSGPGETGETGPSADIPATSTKKRR